MVSMKSMRLMTIGLVTAAVLTGCSDNPEETQPTQAPSATSTPNPSAPAEEVVPGPSNTPVINDEDFVTTSPVEGFTNEEVSLALETAKEFTLVGLTDGDFYSGAWMEMSMEDIVSKFTEQSADPVLDALTSLDPNIPEEAQVLASVAPIFRPTEDTVTTEACADDWQQCLSGDITFSTPDIALSKDGEEQRLQFTYDVNTSRHLSHQGEPATSDITYEMVLVVGNRSGEWKVEAFNNSYEFGAIDTGETAGDSDGES